MKKIYEAPSVVEVRVDLQAHLMEGSPIVRNESNATVNGSGDYEYSLSRHASVWGDDEEENF